VVRSLLVNVEICARRGRGLGIDVQTLSHGPLAAGKTLAALSLGASR
jgi:hypothetical protein